MLRRLRAVCMLLCVTRAVYLRIVRPWHLRWGSTPAECDAPMPGDDLVAHPDLIATRAITIHAPPVEVWPWLVQMGYRRAGWYSYDRLDNDGLHVRRVIPELQHIAVGDMLRTDPTSGFRVEAVEPDRSLVLMIRGIDRGSGGDISCSIGLTPISLPSSDREGTRLVFRVRAEFHGLRARLYGLAFDLGDFVMMRKQLIGIKERAEGVAAGGTWLGRLAHA